MKDSSTDKLGFAGFLAAWVLNPGKIREAVIAAGKASVAGAERAVVVFSEFFGRVMGPALYKFLVFFQAPIFVIWVAVAGIIDNALESEVRQQGIPSILKVSCLLGVALIVGMGLYQRRMAETAPRRVSVFSSGMALLTAWGVNVALLVIHALLTKSQGLYWWAGLGIVIALANFRLITGFLAWVVRKAIEGVEISGETVAELATVLPGLTSDNLHEKLGRILDLLPEEWIEYTMNSWPIKLGLVVLPFWLIVSLHISMGWAGLVGAVYAMVLISSWLAEKSGQAELVEEKSKQFFKSLLNWAWLVTLIVRLIALHPGLSRGVSLLAGRCGNWFSDAVRLHGALIAYHYWYINILFILIGGIALKAVLSFTKSKDDKDGNAFKTALRLGLGGFFGLVTLVGVIGLLTNNFGLWGGGTKGWPNAPLRPGTQAKVIDFAAPPHNETTETSVAVTVSTLEAAACFLNFKVYDPLITKKWVDYDDLNFGRLDDVSVFERDMIADETGTQHSFKVTGLSYGWTVWYQIQCKHTYGDYVGDWSGMDDDWHPANALPPPPKPEPSGPIGPTGPTGSAAAPSASASASAAPGKASPAPHKSGGKALPNLPAPGATTASAPASKLSTAVDRMKASLAALKK